MPPEHARPTADQRAGWNMRTLRERAGISQRRMVVLMRERGHSWHQQTLSRIEKGEQGLRFAEAADVAVILGTSLDRLNWSPPEAEAAEFLYSAGAVVRRAHEHVAEAVTQLLAARANAEVWAGRFAGSESPRVQEARRDALGRLAEWTLEGAVTEGTARFAARGSDENDDRSPGGGDVRGT